MNLKCGVACDNWKVEPYSKAIEKEGYKILKTFKFDRNTTFIQVEVDTLMLEDFKKLLKRLEFTIKRQN